MWAQLKSVSREVNLCEQEDTCTWILTKTGKFTVRSLYFTLKIDQVIWPHGKMWYVGIPLKINGFSSG